jgi:putative hemolysin
LPSGRRTVTTSGSRFGGSGARCAAAAERAAEDLFVWLEIALVILLTLVNGSLAMSELAVVSSRPARLKVLIEQGVVGSRRALALAGDPGRFLSTVQIGITLVGILSGAFSGATLGVRLAGWLAEEGLPAAAAEALGVGVVVVAITYLSLIAGELVPKQIALRNPERIACRVAGPMTALSRVAAPLVWVLDRSGKAVLRVLGHGKIEANKITEEEVKSVIAEATSSGVIERQERDMISGVMRFADRTAKALMTPRRDVESLRIGSDEAEALRTILGTKRTRLPVWDKDPDDIVGILDVRSALVELAQTGKLDIRRHIQAAPVVLDAIEALDVLGTIRDSTIHMAVVVDEYGHFEGVITSADILEAITGAFRDDTGAEPPFVRRNDGSLLVNGWMPVDEFCDAAGKRFARSAEFETVAGLVLSHVGRLPATGETVAIEGWIFEVVDMDGRRIDKLLVRRETNEGARAQAPAA